MTFCVCLWIEIKGVSHSDNLLSEEMLLVFLEKKNVSFV